MRFWIMIIVVVIMSMVLGEMLTGCAADFPLPTAKDEQYVVAGLEGQKQEKPLWCAAAASRMLLSQYGQLPSQCEIASKQHGENCCTSSSVKCSKEVAVETVLPAYGLEVRTAAPSFDAAWELVRDGKAVAIYHYFMQGTPSASGHAVVAYWAYVSGGRRYLIVYDPFIGDKRVWDSSYETGNLAWYRLVWVK